MMNLSGSLSIGPLTLPAAVAAAVLIIGLSYLAGFFRLIRDRDTRRAYSDIFMTPLLPFLLGWKLSLFITDAADAFSNPLMILYATGSLLNILIGLIPATVWTARRWLREPRRRAVSGGMIPAVLTGLILGGAMFLLPSPVQDNESLRLSPVYVTDEAGGTVNIADGGGKPVIINFWASWCPPCRAEMPMLDSVMADPRFDDAAFFIVNAAVTEKSSDQGREWLNDNEIEMPLFLDTGGAAMAAFDVEVLPTTIILDSLGYPVVRKTGAVSRGWLRWGLRKAKKHG